MPEAATVDMKLKVVTLPVCDIDRPRCRMLLRESAHEGYWLSDSAGPTKADGALSLDPPANRGISDVST